MNKKFKKINLILFCLAIITSSCSDKKNNILSPTSKRIGYWEYYDDSGNVSANGSYENGLKKGIWNYNKKTYNGSKRIKWSIAFNDFFKINIPADWELTEKPNSITPLIFKYNDSIQPNGNITLIKEDIIYSIDSITTKLTDQNKINNSYKLHLRQNVEINGKESIYLQQTLNIENRELLIEQFIIKNSPKDYYLISFFVEKSKVKLYHQLFSEMAYSFTFIEEY